MHDDPSVLWAQLTRAHLLLDRCYDALNVEYPPPALADLLDEIAEVIGR